MSELNDHDLLARYARDNSEAAFTALAERHLNLVYSTAFRSVGSAHAAEEIAQAVFIILANKADKLSRRVVLSGWLYQTTRLAAANFLRGEIRRQKREQEAYMQSTFQESADESAWRQIAPLLDEALGKLGERDRNAIVLRFFENKNLREVGLATGVSEDAAKMRVNRALEKLRKLFTKRGVTLSAALIAGAVSANSVSAAPIGLAANITATAAKGTIISATLTNLVKGTMKTMTWMKIKFAVGLGVAVLLVGGAATVAVSQTKSDGALTPQEIAKETQETYAALESYSDSGAVLVTTAGPTVTNTFHIRLQRPDLYRVDWALPIGNGVNFSEGVVWSAGDGHFMQMLSGGKDVYPTPKKSASRQQNLGTAAGVSCSASTTIPGVFFGEQSGNAPLRLVVMGATKLTKEPDAMVGGVDCHVFTSANDPAKLPKSGKLPDNMGSVGLATTTFWIGKKDHLIHQTRMVMDLSKMPSMSDDQIKNALGKTGKPVTPEAIAAMRKMMEGAAKLTRAGNFVFTETHENIVVNQKYLPSDFAR